MLDPAASMWIVVRGDWALFRRIELKHDQVSYPIITPSCARGILDTIHWRPSLHWIVDELTILNPIVFEDRSSPDEPCKWALRDVAYGIRAHVELTDQAGAEETAAAHRGWAASKALTPVDVYLGGKDYPGIAMKVKGEPPTPLALNQDLGILLHGRDFDSRSQVRFFHAVLTDGRLQVPSIDGPTILA